MKTLVLPVLLLSLLAMTVSAEVDLELLKRLLTALKERDAEKEVNQEAEVRKPPYAEIEKRNSYGVVWNGGKEKKLTIFLLKSMSCGKPCRFIITFQTEDGKDFGNEELADWDKNDGMVTYTEEDIMKPVLGNGKGEKTLEGGNSIAGKPDRLPDKLIVKVCRLDKSGGGATCNKRLVDTTKGRDAVFFKTVN